MLAACEAGEVFALLEGGAGGARRAGEALAALWAAVREPWLARALLTYHARTGSVRALDLLARAPEPHARFLLDALQEQLRGERGARHLALRALAPLVARRPAWLHRLPAHPAARDLLRAARHERAPLPLLHALLALAALLPAAPALAAQHAPDLAEALLRPDALDPPPAAAARAHLHLAQLALFRVLYATHPCTLLDALRAHGAELGGGARDAWERAVAALAASVRLHPALVTGSRPREADPARWARLEPHDVLAETRRLELPEGGDSPAPSPTPAPPAPRASPAPAPGSGAHAARAAGALRPGAEGWFPLGERCGAESAPHTPLPAEEGAEPPEAAVEATPENTPARETRAQFRFPDSGAVRAIGRRSRPASPPRKESSPALGEGYAARLARVALERRAADSPVAFAGPGGPPAGVARPEPRGPGARPPPPDLPAEDLEVLQLTAGAPPPWPEPAPTAPPARPAPRRPPPPAARPAHQPPARRPASAERARARTASAAVQTVDVWPEPYEFLLGDLYRPPAEAPPSPRDEPERAPRSQTGTPCERLDTYLQELYLGRGGASAGDLGDRLELAHAQLMYERWRREAHAERNRRLLGRCRQARALELQNAALRERLRALTRERDELRARPAPAPAPPPPPQHPPPAAPALEAALAAERAARLRAEARLAETEAQRAVELAELQRTRGESFEAARHVEALARAALAADRRAEHVRRLRRELLVLAEREARLAQAAAPPPRAAPPARAADRALRAALARAEAEAAAAAARAEAAAAHAHELEASLGARDAAVAELKRATRLAAEEAGARQRALQDKYSALLAVVRAQEARRLERLAECPRRPEPEPERLAEGPRRPEPEPQV